MKLVKILLLVEDMKKANTLDAGTVALRAKLEEFLPTSLSASQFFVDLTDIYEVCIDYTEAVDSIISTDNGDTEKLIDILYSIDSHLFEHLNYHLKSLKKLLPQVIGAVEQRAADTKS